MKEKHMIPLLIMLGLMLSSGLWGGKTAYFKTSANLGLVNGGTVGVRIDNAKNYRLNSFINFNYMTSGVIKYGGVSYAEQRSWNDRFYYMWTGGFDYGKAKPFMGNPGGPNGDEPEYKNFFIPHITFGLGYNFAVWKTGSAFIEWDIGLKASVTNINIGVVF